MILPGNLHSSPHCKFRGDNCVYYHKQDWEKSNASYLWRWNSPLLWILASGKGQEKNKYSMFAFEHNGKKVGSGLFDRLLIRKRQMPVFRKMCRVSLYLFNQKTPVIRVLTLIRAGTVKMIIWARAKLAEIIEKDWARSHKNRCRTHGVVTRPVFQYNHDAFSIENLYSKNRGWNSCWPVLAFLATDEA